MKAQKISAKVCILGDEQVGKSTFATSGPVVRNSYIYSKSVGLNIFYHGPFAPVSESPVSVHLLFWEITLQRHLVPLRHSYLKGCSAAFILCDLSANNPFKHIVADIELIRRASPAAAITIVGNKLDIAVAHDASIVEQIASKHNARFVPLCAKDERAVEPLMMGVAQKLLL